MINRIFDAVLTAYVVWSAEAASVRRQMTAGIDAASCVLVGLDNANAFENFMMGQDCLVNHLEIGTGVGTVAVQGCTTIDCPGFIQACQTAGTTFAGNPVCLPSCM